jgi:hypothetical protein
MQKKRDYKQMLDGDETIQKTIQDEQIEIKRKFKGTEDIQTSQRTIGSRRSQREHRLVLNDGLFSSEESDKNEEEFTPNYNY